MDACYRMIIYADRKVLLAACIPIHCHTAKHNDAAISNTVAAIPAEQAQRASQLQIATDKMRLVRLQYELVIL